MQQRKIFIGISLPATAKKKLTEKLEKWQNLPIRWSFEENLHITLLFIGYVTDEAVMDICARVRAAAQKIEGLDIKFEKINLGPDEKNPKMVWLSGEANENLKNMVVVLENELGIARTFRNEFRPHVTLGRIRQMAWKSADWRTGAPVIAEKYSLLIPVGALEIIESTVERGKRKFITLEACPLK